MVVKTNPLRTAIEQAGQTQRAAAELIGVPLRTLEDWVNGISRCPPPVIRLYRHLAGLERIRFSQYNMRKPI